MRRGWLVCWMLVAACGRDAPPSSVVPRWVAPASTLDFGAVPALNERTVSLPLVNVGRASLRVVSAVVKEDGSPFRIISAPEEVPAQAETSLVLAFVPPRESSYTATLVLRTDDPIQEDVEVSLRGEGRTAAVLELEPALLDFGRVAEGHVVVRPVRLRSRGSAPLVLESLTLESPASPVFQLVGSTRTPAVLDLAREVQVSVRYAVPSGVSAEDVSGALVLRTTDPDQREARVPLRGSVNLAPVPVVSASDESVPGGEVMLDGTASMDPDGDGPLTYAWELVALPVGARAQVLSPGASSSVLRLDPVVSGEYEVALTVTDAAGARSLQPTRARVVAVPAQQLWVDVTWNHAETDLDLHVLRGVDAVLGSVDDCHYANPRPDWGAPGLTEDPELLRDRLTGFGPEVFGYERPVAGTYRVAVVLARENGAVDPRSEATVRVYDRGVLKGEFRRTLSRQDEVWTVADVQWPSGVVTEAL
ncbi:choice-of-anchor D domain-containing protein [Myxococcus sp. AB025B]|uniref:choice-of-anchor D domain-containing protein n=1 Tax=Myxococcus sp. AB025B TaxID=2562794 RepID=UPI0011418D1B|nr:choice-of-anchor D domain-containing protein [Myxococcus sp. AB025B]